MITYLKLFWDIFSLVTFTFDNCHSLVDQKFSETTDFKERFSDRGRTTEHCIVREHWEASEYRTCTIKSPGLYILYPILYLGLISAGPNPRFIFKSSFKSRNCYNGTHRVCDMGQPSVLVLLQSTSWWGKKTKAENERQSSFCKLKLLKKLGLYIHNSFTVVVSSKSTLQIYSSMN